MEDMNILFNDYMKEFKKLSITGKRKEVLDSLREFIAIIDYVAEKEGITLNYLQSTEINDVADGNNVSENDYLEAIMVYVEVAKSLVGEYLDKRI